MDRRVQKTRTALQDALLTLLDAHDYDSITVQHIVDQANVGRTTFYAHYGSKEDLFLDCHDRFVDAPTIEVASAEQLLSTEPRPGLIMFMERIRRQRAMYFLMRRGPAWLEIQNRLHQQASDSLAASLRILFDESESSLPFEMLASYIVGAQFTFTNWWVESQVSYSAHEAATLLQRMRAAAIRDALDL